MITLAHLNAGKTAARSHAMLLQAFTGMLALALESKDLAGAASRSTMTKQAAAAGAHYVKQFDADMRAFINSTVSAAVHDSHAHLSDAMTQERMDQVREYADTVHAELVTGMQAVVEGNIATLLRELRQIRLTASMLETSRGMTAFGAVMKARMGRLEELRFTTADVAGRKWRSVEYVQAMVSKALLQLYVEVFLFCAAVQGDTTARVVYQDPTHEGDGRIFTIAGDGPDSFITIKDAIWHPNSTAGVERVHP
jgi:hypothetical protein